MCCSNLTKMYVLRRVAGRQCMSKNNTILSTGILFWMLDAKEKQLSVHLQIVS